jgi:hypothetical protein
LPKRTVLAKSVMIWPFSILLGHKRRPKLLSRPWLLFHAQNVLEFFSDNLEIEH